MPRKDKEKQKEYDKEYKRLNREKINEYCRNRSLKLGKSGLTLRAEYHINYVYGINPEDYKTMIEQQNNKCAICKEEFNKSPHIDHNHITGKVRGLLCSKCNHALGLLKENKQTISNLLKYIENNE